MTNKLSIRRMVENEAIFRQQNESIQKSLEELDQLATSDGQPITDKDELILHFYCECSDENCRSRIPIKLKEYADIHKQRRCFVLLPGHEVDLLEKITKKTNDYFVVEKLIIPPERPQKLNQTDIDNS